MRRSEGTIRIGVGGWTYEPWRKSFYPEGQPHRLELEYASRRLTSIEINGTYYRRQSPDTFRKWRDETPEDFVFAVKAPRYATNRKVLADAGETVERFLTGGVMELKDKLGPIDWQFLPTKKFDADDFAAFLALLPPRIDGRDLRHAVEVRHASFRTAEFVAMARDAGVAVVIAADGPYPSLADLTAPFVYARLMGTGADQPLGYAPAELDRWAERARTWAGGGAPDDLAPLAPAAPSGGGRDVFIYVISGHKSVNPQAAMALIQRLG
ncbi:MAG: DUF72 domain-containing protein [Rhodospirillales bacterium]